MLIADFYTAATPASEIKAAGFGGASVYLSHQSGKCATKAQVDSYRAAGLVVSMNFEDEPLQALNGHGQGVADATFAIGLAKELGYPAGCVIFYSVDGLLYFSESEIPAGDRTAILAYFEGVASVGGEYEVGVYGGISTVELVMGAGQAKAAWQTSAGSDGQISPDAALYQSAFGSVFDTDRVLKTIPLWGLDTPTPTPTPTPPLEDDMLTSIIVNGYLHVMQVGPGGGLRHWSLDAGNWTFNEPVGSGLDPAVAPSAQVLNGILHVTCARAAAATPLVATLTAAGAWSTAGLPS